MQAWGSRSRFDDRDTHAEPTKSGVLGLVCAALGRERHETLTDLDALRFGVRIDADGRAMTDFHTAQEVARAGGTGTSAVTSRRHYLSDARFLAGLEGDDDTLPLLREIGAALRNPQWPLSLGRKSFPLTIPPYFPPEYGGSLRKDKILEEALQAETWRWLCEAEKRRAPESLRLVIEDNAGSIVQSDQAPRSFEDRAFGLRRMRAYVCERTGELEPWITL